MTRTRRQWVLLGWLSAMLAGLMGCQPPEVPQTTRDPRTQKWLERARASFRTADMDDAGDAAEEALRVAPTDPEVRVVASHIALAKLDYERVIKLTAGIDSSESHALRGRAYWYWGKPTEAATELQALLRDPDTHDNWAKQVILLANRGTGRKPFAITGGIVGATEIPRTRAMAMVVPIEVDGEQGLALLSTGTAEVALDSGQRREPSWVSIRIAGRVEFHDVPALTEDLSGTARQLGVPSLKAVLGANFLRHANATFDYSGRQFVVRSFEPPRPPSATAVGLSYIRGGAMIARASLGLGTGSPSTFLIDTTVAFPLALDDQGWRKAGVELASLRAVPNEPKLKEGIVPAMRIGTLDISQVPGAAGVDFSAKEQALGLDLDGIMGSGLLGHYRVTLAEGGRTLWMEQEAIAPAEPAPAAAPASPEPALQPKAPTLVRPPAVPPPAGSAAPRKFP